MVWGTVPGTTVPPTLPIRRRSSSLGRWEEGKESCEVLPSTDVESPPLFAGGLLPEKYGSEYIFFFFFVFLRRTVAVVFVPLFVSCLW